MTHLKFVLYSLFYHLRAVKDLFSNLDPMWDISVVQRWANVFEKATERRLINQLKSLHKVSVNIYMSNKTN
jgi:hypothetical protein